MPALLQDTDGDSQSTDKEAMEAFDPVDESDSGAQEGDSSSDEELGVHRASADTAPGFQRAELDHLDSFGMVAEETAEPAAWDDADNFEAMLVAEMDRLMQASDGSGDEDMALEASGDEDMALQASVPDEREESGGAGPQPKGRHSAEPDWRRRPVLKRPGALKKPAAAQPPKPSKMCGGYGGEVCTFCPQHSGHRARIHPERGLEHCIFCNSERMREASSVTRHENRNQGNVTLYNGHLNILIWHGHFTLCLAGAPNTF